MKKNLFKSIAGIALALAMSGTVHGQLAINEVPSSHIDPSAKALAANNESNNFSRKAARDLARSFKDVSGENWFNLPDGYFVRFNSNNIDHMVFFDKKGNRRYTIRNYDETKLPVDVRHIVRSTYYDYDIRLVQEIESALGTITYLVHLEGKTEWMNLRVVNGEMDVFEKYHKSE
jgi:hypothetical protein